MTGDATQADPVLDEAVRPRDGRHQRSARSRAAIVEACLTLVRSGVARPSSSQIAEAAGVTQRTLFNQFGDMDTLLWAVAARQTELFLSMQPRPHDGSRAQRVEHFVEELADLLEATMRVRWTVLTTLSTTELAIDAVRQARQIIRATTVTVFASELEPLDTARRDALLDAFDPALDAAVWRLRRELYGMSNDECCAAVTAQVEALLDQAAASAAPPQTIDLDAPMSEGARSESA